MKQRVYTDRGYGWASIHLVVRSGGIVILTEDARLRSPEQETSVVPVGTPLVRSERLMRRTAKKSPEERRTHLVVEEGLHTLERLCVHVQRFEAEDAQLMLRRSPQMEKIAKDLYICGQLSFDDHERITNALASIRESFNEFKRADRKVATREHIDTANAQRSRVGRFKAMPAASAAFASRRDIQARFKEASQIHVAFGANSLRVRELLDDVWRRMDAVWKLFQVGDNGLPREISFAMDSRTRTHSMVRIVSSQMEEHGRELEEILALPYLPMARCTRVGFERLAIGVRSHRRKQVKDTVEQIRSTLRRMRMLWYVETALIRVLSFPSTSLNGPTYQPRTIEAFKDRLGRAKDRVRDLKDNEFDPSLRQLVRDYLVAAETNVGQERFEEARDELKRLAHELRVQSLAVGQQAA